MAVEELPDGAPKSKKKLMIIIIAAVVLLLGGGGAAFFLMGSDSSEPEQEQAETVEENTNPVAYVNIAQPFLFNVSGDLRDRMVQIKVQLMVRGSENEELARYHSPLVESTLLGTFASATVDQLRSATGRVDLRKQATDDIKAAMTKVVGTPVIERVLFTDFVIQ